MLGRPTQRFISPMSHRMHSEDKYGGGKKGVKAEIAATGARYALHAWEQRHAHDHEDHER